MAKVKELAATNGNQEINLKMLDVELVDDNTGAVLKINADPATIEEDIKIYSIHLSQARSIPPEGEIPVADPIIAYLYDELYKTNAKSQEEEESRLNFVTGHAQAYYTQQRESIAGEAVILAITMDNELTNEPKPYPELQLRKRRGIIDIPPPKKDINLSGVEYALKQLIDYLEANPNLTMKFMQLRKNLESRITLTMLGSSRQAGFQS